MKMLQLSCYNFYVFFICETYRHVLKVKFTITRYVKCFVPGISTSKNVFKEIESVNSNAPSRALVFDKYLMKYIYKMESLKGHYTFT